eukprot:2305040-Amphidinium_carterae.1
MARCVNTSTSYPCQALLRMRDRRLALTSEVTLLAWAAHWPMKPSARRLLGKHSDRKDRTMLVHSRDACMATLHEVARMMTNISRGTFDPDATRSVILHNILRPFLPSSDLATKPPFGATLVQANGMIANLSISAKELALCRYCHLLN